MNPIDFVILGILVLILGFAAWCIYKSKKNGKKCIGCPDNCACSKGNCGGGCSGCQDCK